MLQLFYKIKKDNDGQSLLEVILAMAIFSLITAAMATMVTGSFTALTQGGEQTEAQALAQEAIESVRSIRDGAWNELVYTTSSASISNNQWIFTGEGSTETIGKYTRIISFSDVCRDSNDDITACPGSYIDVQAKKMTVNVSWNTNQGKSNFVQQVTYLTDWDSQEWKQTDWSGGNGQTIWSDDTRYDSDDGNIDYGTNGEIRLAASGSGNCTVHNWTFDTSSDYTYNPSYIEVNSSMASLLDQGGGGVCIGTPNACDTFVNSSTCSAQTGCAWTSGAGGNTTNSGFDSGTTGWTYADWGQGGGEVNVAGSRITSGGNPGGYIQISAPSGSGDELGGYWYQTFTTTGNNSVGTLNFDWRVTGYQASPITFKAYVFVDTGTGAPTIGQEVWVSNEITATSGWVSINNVDVSAKITTAGTYYLKVAFWVETPGSSRGPFTIGYDNVLLSWTGASSCTGTPNACNTFADTSTCAAQTGCAWSSVPLYSSNNPSIYPTASFTAPGLETWSSFAENSVKNGGEIYYQLSDNDGSTWQYWDGGAWSNAIGATDYNTASVIDTNISGFSTSTGQIKFKAFLSSNGSQLVQLDNVLVNYNSNSAGGSGYAVFGYFVSSAFNMNSVSSVQVLDWDEIQPIGTNIQTQLRVAPDSGGSPGIWTSWYGANGIGTYFTNPLGAFAPTILNGKQWVQYRAELTGDTTNTPILQEVRISHK